MKDTGSSGNVGRCPKWLEPVEDTAINKLKTTCKFSNSLPPNDTQVKCRRRGRDLVDVLSVTHS